MAGGGATHQMRAAKALQNWASGADIRSGTRHPRNVACQDFSAGAKA